MANKKNIQGNRPASGGPGNKPGGGGNRPKFNSYWIIGIILLVMIGFQFIGSGGSLKEIDSNRFFQILRKGDIEKLVIVNKEKVEVYIKHQMLGYRFRSATRIAVSAAEFRGAPGGLFGQFEGHGRVALRLEHLF